MTNLLLEIAGTGNFVELDAVAGFPRNATAVSMQVRGAADMTYHYVRQTAYWTVKSGTARTIQGRFDPGELFVQAAVGQVIEIEISTQLTV
jgi:hypothetical protein